MSCERTNLFIHKIALTSVLLFYVTAVYGDVCYDYIGCFSQDPPWVQATRPFPPPQDPQQNNVSLTFYNRNVKNGQFVKVYPNITSNIKGFNPRKRTVTITHGFASSSSSDWVGDMKDKYLKNMDANVFLVNWEQGASGVNYFQAGANTRVVGAILGRFLKYLIKNKGAKYNNFHLIGHSLGSHITAYAANITNNASTKGEKIARITGLDPAQPGFESLEPTVRLNKNSAKFVEAIHSDAKPFLPLFGFGYLTNLGHVDFYLNKGFDQPKCVDTNPVTNLTSIDQLQNITVEVISNAVSCSHGRAYKIFTSSIDPSVKCEFIGHRLTTTTPVTSNQMTCGVNGMDCIKMGLNTTSQKPRGAFQVMTSGEKPYCCYNYSAVTGCSSTPKNSSTINV